MTASSGYHNKVCLPNHQTNFLNSEIPSGKCTNNVKCSRYKIKLNKSIIRFIFLYCTYTVIFKINIFKRNINAVPKKSIKKLYIGT